MIAIRRATSTTTKNSRGAEMPDDKNAKQISSLAASAELGLQALPASAKPTLPSVKTPVAVVKLRDVKDAPAPMSCQQTLTLTFFFDGTLNNLDADIWSFEHSSVARLYRAHLEDSEATGLYRFYIPGIGTLFKDREVNDPGDTTFGKAFARQGQARLDWAFARLKEKVQGAEKRAQNPTNKICWIKVAVFGFSRGAALARAFCRDLQKLSTASTASNTGWQLKQGNYPIEITFLGLFDTVASSGLPPSANNTLRRNRYAKAIGAAAKLASPGGLVRTLLEPAEVPELKQLAFGQPGADPAPGPADGHGDWAAGLQIGSMVTRCVHMMAGHENRNSFPLDSTLFEAAPSNFHFPAGVSEMIYPGVHSDVGGGYRPGEGGCRSEKGSQLSLIALRAMHAEAIKLVPLRPFTAFPKALFEDFALDAEGAKHFAHMVDLTNHYVAVVAQTSVPGSTVGMGGQINAHMKLYYAARFRRIRAEASAGTTDRQTRIGGNEKQFKADRDTIDAASKQARQDLYTAQQAQEQLRLRDEVQRMAKMRYGTPTDPSITQRYDEAKDVTRQKLEAFDRLRARRATAANDSDLSAAITKFDRMLLEDAKQICLWMKEDPKLKLRPHYAALIEAYRDEYERGKGLSLTADAKLIELFDHYVHDSLAGFDTDETWPSDPRMIYVGGDLKLRYAHGPAQDAPSTMAA
jgi:Uncharacterized alpha/beta hydrolase domain (DUF2235)